MNWVCVYEYLDNDEDKVILWKAKVSKGLAYLYTERGKLTWFMTYISNVTITLDTEVIVSRITYKEAKLKAEEIINNL